jgi:hypothetical protein
MLIILIMGIFLILHSLVHLLYAGQSERFFELRPGISWPDGSWAFSKLLGDKAIKRMASITLVLAALGFVVGGLGLFLREDLWRPVTVAATVLSGAIFILFWDGKGNALGDKGGVSLLINLALLVFTQFLKWPA